MLISPQDLAERCFGWAAHLGRMSEVQFRNPMLVEFAWRNQRNATDLILTALDLRLGEITVEEVLQEYRTEYYFDAPVKAIVEAEKVVA
jgi:hypothetical protein